MLMSLPAAIASRTTNQGKTTYNPYAIATVPTKAAIRMATRLEGCNAARGFRHTMGAARQAISTADVAATKYKGYACIVNRHSPPPATFQVNAYGSSDVNSTTSTMRPFAENGQLTSPAIASHDNVTPVRGNHPSKPIHLMTNGRTKRPVRPVSIAAR